MADSADDYGERAATEDEVDDWVTMVRAGKAATTGGYRPRPNQFDRMRAVFGSGRASSEGDE